MAGVGWRHLKLHPASPFSGSPSPPSARRYKSSLLCSARRIPFRCFVDKRVVTTPARCCPSSASARAINSSSFASPSPSPTPSVLWARRKSRTRPAISSRLRNWAFITPSFLEFPLSGTERGPGGEDLLLRSERLFSGEDLSDATAASDKSGHTDSYSPLLGVCPRWRTILVPRNALTPKRTSSRAKRCPHISTRKCVSGARDASSLERGRLTLARGHPSAARDRSDGPRGRSLARRGQLFVRFGALRGARGRCLAPPRALAPGRGASRGPRGRLSVARRPCYVDRGQLTLKRRTFISKRGQLGSSFSPLLFLTSERALVIPSAAGARDLL